MTDQDIAIAIAMAEHKSINLFIGATPAQILTAVEMNIPVQQVVDLMNVWESKVTAVIDYKRRLKG